MSFEPRVYLRHILVEAEYLLTARSELTFETFSANDTLQRAFVRSLEIIGEAAKKVPKDFRAEHPEVDWRAMISSMLVPHLIRRRSNRDFESK